LKPFSKMETGTDSIRSESLPYVNKKDFT